MHQSTTKQKVTREAETKTSDVKSELQQFARLLDQFFAGIGI